MIIEEYLNYRKELLDQSKDEEGFIQETLVLSEVLPSMLDAKLIDSEDYNNAYFKSNADKLKINAYCVNESGERLQLFFIDENSIDLSATEKELLVSTKSSYDSQFKRCMNFLNKAIKGHLNDEIQDSSPVRPLVSQIASSAGAEQFDVIEIFLISTTATVSLRGPEPQPNRIDFDDEDLKISYTKNREKKSKTLLIKKRLIDLNFLYNVIISQGNREALIVDFIKMFGNPIPAIRAADEEHFESYLCALPASVIAGLYKDFSTRLLEKNVRSFLQFKGVNKGIRETIRKEPEKFVAYNNGLTITATSAQITGDSDLLSIKSLTDFQIVNGGQTTATIYFTQKDGFDISKVKVMAKINVAKETSDEDLEELISNISTFSNAQSRVSKVDLRSRNPQLVRIKSISESVMTPSGYKWFFERAKGEFNTKMRIAGSNKNRLIKEYPTERRFSKELMAKYYSAWGDQPHLVKKGGEKIFRYFIEKLAGEGDFKKPITVNRDFYEELISKIILFRRLEKIYGSGKNSMGQLRSAVVPYTISVLYIATDGNKNAPSFDLLKIWKNEVLENDLEDYLTALLKLVNELIKKYSDSDDFGEYSKKLELWNRVKKSSEIKSFLDSESSSKISSNYGINKEELKKRKGAAESIKEVDFHKIYSTVLVHTNGAEYYRQIRAKLFESLDDSYESRKIDKLITLISTKKDLDIELIDFEQSLMRKIRNDHPEIVDSINFDLDYLLHNTLEFIVQKYNEAISSSRNIASEFSKIEELAKIKKTKYSSIFGEIGKKLMKAEAPTIQDVFYASHYLLSAGKPSRISSSEDVKISEMVLRQMVEWEAKNNVLSRNERAYIADFAFGLQKRTSFHDKNLERHLTSLIQSGFKLE
ncbi:MAG: hypothetical protein ACI8Q1_001175 [Parvicella sp.]|jgi:hypothetical protein